MGETKMFSLRESENFVEYCEFYAIEEKEVLEDSKIAAYIEKNRFNLESLIAGYTSMAELNQELCDELWGCECAQIDPQEN